MMGEWIVMYVCMYVCPLHAGEAESQVTRDVGGAVGSAKISSKEEFVW